MGMVTTPDGLQTWVPDALGPVPPPLDSALAGAPGLPPVPAQAPLVASPAPAPQPSAPPTVAPQPSAPPAVASPRPTVGKPATQDQQLERKASSAGESAAAEKETQAQLQQQTGTIEQQQQDEIARQKAEGYARAEGLQQHADIAQADRQAKIVDAAKQTESAVNAYSSYKIDEGRRWSNLSTGRKILAGISVALSGLGDALMKRSGPNAAISIIQDAIKDDVASQWKKREALGQEVGLRNSHVSALRQISGDAAEAERLQVAGEYKKVADQIDATASKYSGPLAKQRAQAAASELRAQADQIIGTSAEQQIARNFRREEIGTARAQLGLGYAHLSEQRREFGLSQEQALKFHQDEMANKAAELKLHGDAKGSAALLKQSEEDRKLAMIDARTVTGPDGKPTVTYEPVKNADGSKWLAPDEETARSIRGQRKDAEMIVSLIDGLRELRREKGWSSDIVKSPEWQRMTANFSQLQAKEKDLLKLGALTGDDYNLLKGVFGGTDPTGMRDPMPGLEQARANTVEAFNKSLRHEGNYTGEPIKFTDAFGAGKPSESEEKRRNRVLESKLPMPEDLAGVGVGPGGLPRILGVTSPDFAAANDMGVNVSQYRVLEAQRAMLANPETARQARETLGGILTNPAAPDNVKRAAREILGGDLADLAKRGSETYR